MPDAVHLIMHLPSYDLRDALDAIRTLDGKNGWCVELSHNTKGDVGGGRGGGECECYECGESGHYARERCSKTSPLGVGSARCRRPSPRRGTSPSYGPRSYSPRYSPRRRKSPPRRSISPGRGRRYSWSPYANGL